MEERSIGYARQVEDMRIAIYKDTLKNRRGADNAVLALAAGLRERGHDAVVFEQETLADRLAERWDVVISAGTNELLDLAGYAGAPVVQQFHTDPKSQFKWKRVIRNLKIRKALRKVAAIQVLRGEFVAQVAKYGPQVAVIGNWSEWEGRARTERPASKTIVYPAAFGKGKNQRLAAEAFALISPEFPDWTLELYGNGEPDFVLPTAVRLMGYCDLGPVYASCAFVAFPSLDEGFPLTLVDAAAFGCPAVMVRDWIGAAAAGGGIVSKPTVADYAAAMRRLMSNLELVREMGLAAKRFCQERYSRKSILDKWETLLESVVK